jgi:hypothetical protein
LWHILYLKVNKGGNKMAMSRKEIAEDLAYRYVTFHKGEDWRTVRYFGLATWRSIAPWLVGNPGKLKGWKAGIVTTNMVKENETIWYQPTEGFWESDVKPLVLQYDKGALRTVPYSEDSYTPTYEATYALSVTDKFID